MSVDASEPPPLVHTPTNEEDSEAEDDDEEEVDAPPPPPPPADKEEVLLLVNADNCFNLLNRHSMLWTVWHRWAKASRFAFNCYRHEVRLVIRRPGKDAIFLLSLENVTQGDPLMMALFGIAV